MENKLQQAKDAVAKKYGYKSFEQFDDKSTFGYNHDTPKIIDEIALEYHRLMSEWVSVDDETPPINIELLVESPTGINHLSRWRPAYNIFTCQSKGESTLDWKWKRI